MKLSNKTQIHLFPLENDVLNWMGNELSLDENEIFVKQLESSIIISRKMTGHGFYLEFQVDQSAPSFSKKNFTIKDVIAKVSGMKYSAGFILFIKSGYIKTLEGFATGEPWLEGQNYQYELFSFPDPQKKA